jgi:ribosomal protein S18 acetylase RimI-like enzyme
VRQAQPVPAFDPSRLALRPIVDADLPFLIDLYAELREDELRPVPWTEAQKRAFIEAQFQAQHAHYTTNYSGASLDLILIDGVRAGRLYVHRSPSELRIMDIAISAAYRGQGAGTYLVTRLLDEAGASGRKVTLHVEHNNPAQSLYARLGFVPVAEVGVYQLLAWQAEHM